MADSGRPAFGTITDEQMMLAAMVQGLSDHAVDERRAAIRWLEQFAGEQSGGCSNSPEAIRTAASVCAWPLAACSESTASNRSRSLKRKFRPCAKKRARSVSQKCGHSGRSPAPSTGRGSGGYLIYKVFVLDHKKREGPGASKRTGPVVPHWNPFLEESLLPFTTHWRRRDQLRRVHEAARGPSAAPVVIALIAVAVVSVLRCRPEQALHPSGGRSGQGGDFLFDAIIGSVEHDHPPYSS
jgi:hypothetical protein